MNDAHERLDPSVGKDAALIEQVARALSIPQHHTTWDTLSDAEKDLFYMQADYAMHVFADRLSVMEEALNLFVRAAYPVATEINPRGHNWSEAYLDQALANAAALAKLEQD